MISRKILSILVLATSATTVNATSFTKEHTGWYAGGNLATMNVDMESDNGFGKEKAKTTAIGIYGGYNFNHYFGLEMAFFDSGDVAESNGIRAYYIEPVIFTPKFTYQITDTFALYGKLGIALTGYLVDEKNPLPGSDENIMWTGAGVTAGIGTQISLSKRLNMRIAYDYTQSSMEPVDDLYFDGMDVYYIDDIDVSAGRLSIGMHCQF